MRLTQIAIACAGVLAASPAYAHFKLATPTNWTTMSTDGTPQKVQPCGNEGEPPASSPVTEYTAGQTIDITFDETKFHSGHYRVSLAADQASLPHDPDGDVVPGPSECGSLAINPSPTLPLLADGLLVHTKPFVGTQTMQVTLPAGMTCDHCVLQVVQFMSQHAAPCFYHHCAYVKITAASGGIDAGPGGGGIDAGTGGGGIDGGTGGGLDAGPVAGGGDDAGVSGGGSSGGGGCSIAGKDVTGAALLALTVGLVLARRRRR